MLEQMVTGAGVVVYVSRLMSRIGVRHGFSTRKGGVSEGAFASLNLGNHGGCAMQDDAGRIEENYRRVMEAAGLAGRRLCGVKQVHGSRVVEVGDGEQGGEVREGDALVTGNAGCVLSVRVADCVPVLLASGDGRRVAAVHAGWRGVLAEVVVVAVGEVGRMGDEGGMVAAIGPCIGMEAFEVGGEVLEEFERVFGVGAPIRRDCEGKGHVDLREAVRRQLVDAGVGAERIDTTDRCTWRDAGEFFSHRRERGMTGRMAALVSPRG